MVSARLQPEKNRGRLRFDGKLIKLPKETKNLGHLHARLWKKSDRCLGDDEFGCQRVTLFTRCAFNNRKK